MDRIVTKSVSRFARNTVDTMTTIRKLKDKGVGVFFEKEDIDTLDSKGELLITIMSSLAQEESRSISENVTWGWRKRIADGKDQPMTMNFKVCNVDTVRIRAVMADHPEQFPHLAPKAGIERQALRLSVYGFDELVREAANAGELTVDRDTVLCFETNTAGEMIVNMSRVTGENSLDPLSLSRAETEGCRQVREIFAFLKVRVPGFEEARLEMSGPGIGVRSSRRMLGDYVLTAEDILGNRLFEDDVAVCGYPIDIHSSDGAKTKSRFLRWGRFTAFPIAA